jgi:hypothetical protein
MKLLALLDGPWGRRAFLVGSLLAVAVTLYVRVRHLDNYTLDTGGYDQNVMQGTLRVLDGGPLYADPEHPPFAIVQYGPLHMVLVGSTCRMLGLTAADVQGAYVVTRMIVLLLNLIACFVLYRIGRSIGISAVLSIGMSGFFFANLAVFYYARPDSLYILFFLLHVLAFLRWLRAPAEERGWMDLLPVACYAALALFTKQTGVLAFLLSGGYLLLHRQWRDLMRLAAWSILFFLLGLALLSTQGGLENAYKNMVLGVANGVTLVWLIAMFTSKYMLIGIGWMAIGLNIAWRTRKEKTDATTRYLAWGVVACLGWAMLTGLKAGMNLNYFTEHFLFAVLLAIHWMSGDPARVWMRRAVLLYLPGLALLRAAMYFSAFEVTRYYADEPAAYAAEVEMASAIAPFLREDEYLFLLDRGYTELFLPYHTLLDQKDIISASGEDLRLDHSRFFALLEAGRVPFIATTRLDPLPEFEGHSFDAYQPWATFGAWRVLVLTDSTMPPPIP